MSPGVFAHGSDKPVPTPIQSLNKRGLLARSPSTPLRSTLKFLGLRLDVSIWPYRIEQLIMRHQPSGALDQAGKWREILDGSR